MSGTKHCLILSIFSYFVLQNTYVKHKIKVFCHQLTILFLSVFHFMFILSSYSAPAMKLFPEVS